MYRAQQPSALPLPVPLAQPFLSYPLDMQQPVYNTIMRFGAGPLAVYPEGYNLNAMPFDAQANPTSRIYAMAPMAHWQQGYNTPFTGGAGPTYPILGHHRNQNYYQSPVPQAYNAPCRVEPTYPMGPSQHRHRNHVPQEYNAAPFIAGPIYPMRQHTNQQYRNRSQAPTSGPRRNQRKRHRKAEPHTKYHQRHDSFGSVVKDRSTGVDPGMARISTSNETRAGKVWRTPSENLLMANCNLTSQ